MTDLERKLAETLREQGGEVTPDLSRRVGGAAAPPAKAASGPPCG